MQNAEALSGQQISEFLKGSQGIEFTGQSRADIYGWTERMLVAQEYGRQGVCVASARESLPYTVSQPAPGRVTIWQRLCYEIMSGISTPPIRFTTTCRIKSSRKWAPTAT